ncbi:hypothetical protein [Oceanobacillus salinisoli]|uniref:hypothetical protein n=1 Tax=Oceanobacillus salinisoli TaxID=2678611 RepID=UPI0012E1D542|nr:hypothetical protein [Oceanobacillus salinisoli]
MKKNKSNTTFYMILSLIFVGAIGIIVFIFNVIENRAEKERAVEEQKESVIDNIKTEDQEPDQSNEANEESPSSETTGKNVDENKLIAEVHERLNEMTGWGRYQNFDFQDSNDLHRIEIIMERLERLIENSTDDVLLNDYTNAYLVVEKSLEEEDVEGVLHAHRIFHDLDIHLNDYDSNEIFGYTEWKSGQQPRAITNYLNE